MLLKAQRAAPHTSTGAVELAASFFRWYYRYPTPTAADIGRVSSLFVPGKEAVAQNALLNAYERSPNPAAAIVGDTTPFVVSTANGNWATQPGQADRDVLVDARAEFVINGSPDSSKTVALSFTMHWQDGAWRLTDIGNANTRQLAAAAQQFTGGC